MAVAEAGEDCLSAPMKLWSGFRRSKTTTAVARAAADLAVAVHLGLEFLRNKLRQLLIQDHMLKA